MEEDGNEDEETEEGELDAETGYYDVFAESEVSRGATGHDTASWMALVGEDVFVENMGMYQPLERRTIKYRQSRIFWSSRFCG